MKNSVLKSNLFFVKASYLFFVIVMLWSSSIFGQNIIINEFMASNGTTLSDEFGEFDDWVELYNPTNSPVDIGGMYLTDALTNPTLWQIPSNASGQTTIAPNGYMILWFDKETDQGPLHINAKLGSSGEDLAIFSSTGTLIDSRTFDVQYENVSEGRTPNGGAAWDYFPAATPGSANNTTPGLSKADSPIASVGSGLFSNTQTVQLSTTTPNGEIFYTTDGSIPTPFANLYTGPISISANTPLRAVTFANGFLESKPATFNYLFNVSHTFPIVNITAGDDLLFDPAIGIYPNYTEDIEIPAHVELIETNGTVGFSQIAEIEIHGSGSAAAPQKSIALKAKKSLGGKKFEYPVFDDLNFDAYRSLIVRNSGQDHNITMFRDALVSSLVRDLSDVNGIIEPPKLYTQGHRPSVVYINGEYWGIHNIRERMDKRYLKVHFDLDDDEVDFLENNDEVKEGDLVEWNSVVDFLNNNDLTNDASFNELNEKIDTDHYLDYVVFNLYIDNYDWPGNNNQRWREKVPNAKWRFMTYDLDFTFGLFTPQGWNSGVWFNNSISRLSNENGYNWPNPDWSTLLFRKMITNEKWKTKLINRMADQINVLYDADRINGRIDNFKAVYTPEMPQHIDRWTTGFLDWDNHIEVLKTFSNNRAGAFQQHVISTFNNVNSTAEVTLNANPSNGGAVKFSTLTLGQNQFPWTGTYFTGVDIPAEAVANPGFVFTGWSVGQLGNNSSSSINLSGNISITANFSPIVNQQNQSINFNTISDKLSTDNPFQIFASASSGLPVSFEIISGPATMIGNTISLNGNTGTVVVEASQNGNSNYLPAPIETRVFNVTNPNQGNNPTVTLSTASTIVTGTFTVNIDFNESVTDLTLAEVNVSNGTKSNSAGFGSSYSFTVTPNNFGLILINIPAGSAFDNDGNPNDASSTLEVDYPNPNAQNPTVSLNTFSNNVTGDFIVNAIFSESVLGLNLNEIQVTNGNASNLNGSGTNYSFTISPINNGSVGINIPAGVAANNNGITNDASNSLQVNYQNNNTGNPTVTLSTSSSTVTGSFTVDINFNESVTDLTLAEVNVSNGTKSNAAGSGSSYSFTVTPNNFGLITINIPAGSAFNSNGNPNNASNILELNYPNSNSQNPTVILSTSSSTVTDSFTVNIDFNKSVTDLTLTEVNVSNGTKSNAAGSGSSYSFTVTPNNFGLIIINLPVGIAFDSDGNPNNASNILEVDYPDPNTGGGACTTLNNLSLNQPTSQSGTQQSGNASRAVDGNTNGDFWSGNSVSLTDWQQNPWWQVDLGEIAQIKEIIIWNRKDCCLDKLKDYYVLVSETPFNSTDLNATINQSGVTSYYQNSTAGRPSNISINQTGRYVRIQIQGGAFLNLAEVEVMGCTSGSTADLNSTYCESEGQSQIQEWIKTVGLNDLFNTSGSDNGYGDYTNLTATLQAGQTYPLVLNPGFSYFIHQEYWKVWIDYNQDGVFDDVNELLYEGNSAGAITTEVNIPQAINNGFTRMRVSMKWNSSPSSCEVFSFGEVEDYMVNLSGGSGVLIALLPNQLPTAQVEKGLKANVYPNPVEQILVLDYTTSRTGDLSISIMNVEGKIMYQKEENVIVGGDRMFIDFVNYPAGVYTIFIKQGSQQEAIRVVKIRD